MIHIHAPAPERKSIRWDNCPDCKKRSPFVTFFYEWYGPNSTCMRCGRRWSDGEWMPLDFCRTARADSKRDARRYYKATK